LPCRRWPFGRAWRHLPGRSRSKCTTAQQQQQEQAREARIKAGNASIDKTFAPFNDAFYASRSKAYTDWAQPQLEDQYANQRKDLIYGLSRNGLLSSTVGNEKTAHLKGQYDNERIQLADQALAEATKARSAINNTKMDLQNQLVATGDPSAAASNALAAARVNQEATPFRPLRIMIQNETAGLANLGGGPAIAASSAPLPMVLQDSYPPGASRTVG
jgi:hypothetical protein